MPQWEYRFGNILESGPTEVSPDKPLDRNRWLAEQLQVLNDLGATGWEVVEILGPPNYSNGTVLLKRECRSEG